MGIILSTLAFMILITVIVGVHELGHLLVARKNGVFVEAFSIGYGTVLLEKTDKYGTKWRISLIPLGGYVKMFGDADVSSVREVNTTNISEEDLNKLSIHRKQPWQKLLVAVSGPIANFLFAILVLFSVGLIKGFPTYTNTVNIVSEDTVAYKAGIRNGDKFIKANGENIENFSDIKEAIKQNVGKDLNLEVERNGTNLLINVKMYKENDMTPITALGITPSETIFKKTSFIKAITTSCYTTYNIAYENMKAISQMLIGKRSVKDVNGIFSIVKLSSDSASSGIVSFLSMMALISIVLGAVNLLPIPILDGGTAFISIIEWIIGRSLNTKFVDVIFTIGLIVIAGLMFIGIWNDITQMSFFKRIYATIMHP